MAIKIVIPSYRRPDNVLALSEVTPELQEKYYVIAVRKSEEEQYKKNYPHPEYLILPDGNYGIRETRQYINEYSTGKIIVIDDDVRFRRTYPKPCLSCKDKGKPQVNWARYTKETTSEVLEDMIEYLETLMDQYYFGGIRSLATQPRVYERVIPYVLNKAVIWSAFFNLDHFDTEEFNYNNGPAMLEDIYINVEYFDKGYDIPSVTKFGISKPTKIGEQGGGCSEMTNRSSIHNKACIEMEQTYPHYIKAIESKTLSSAKHLNNEMLSVRCVFKRKLTKPLF